MKNTKKMTNYYYVCVFTENGPVYVTSVSNVDKRPHEYRKFVAKLEALHFVEPIEVIMYFEGKSQYQITTTGL